MRYPAYIDNPFVFPEFFRVRMHYPHRGLPDVNAALSQALAPAVAQSGIGRGHKVAVAVGSRGITNLVQMITTLCATLRDIGASPVIVPAMGSHGGATAKGQTEVLQALGVTEATCNAPVCASLDVKQVASVLGDVPVYFSTDALACDHTLCINRIKPHTKFKAPVESGIFKMLCVGLGKHQGALTYHRFALKHGFFPLLKAMGQAAASATNFRFGIGVIEDAFDDTMQIAAISANRLLDEEPALLATAMENIPRLPFDRLDLLVLARIGKEISGSGMDPNVTGRAYDLMEDDFSGILNVTRLAILNLSEKTAGNGIGLGNADFITEKVYQALDYETMVINALTSMSLRKAFIPVRLPDDRRAIQAGFTTLGPVAAKQVSAVIARDTLHITEFLASCALREKIEAVPEAEIIETLRLSFDAAGNLKTDPYLDPSDGF
jgi:hypothetical protein